MNIDIFSYVETAVRSLYLVSRDSYLRASAVRISATIFVWMKSASCFELAIRDYVSEFICVRIVLSFEKYSPPRLPIEVTCIALY